MPRGTPIPEWKKEKIIHLKVKEHLTYLAISERLNISKSSVIQILRKWRKEK